MIKSLILTNGLNSEVVKRALTPLEETTSEGFDMVGQFLDTSSGLSGETISSLFVMGIIVILSIIIAICARFANPLKKPKGILFLAEAGVNLFDGLVCELMGKRYKNFGGFIMGIAVYLFIAFIWGLTGFPSPITNLATPLSLGLIAFTLIHFNAAKTNKLRYFKRYVDPFPIFLPINLISMWAPLLSLTLRLFGNALAGWTLMTLVYQGFNSLGNSVINFIVGAEAQSLNAGGILSSFVAPVLHAYFDLFSGLIQTTVFIFLTMIFVANEGPEDDEEFEFQREGGR